jgi:hypothetical protein
MVLSDAAMPLLLACPFYIKEQGLSTAVGCKKTRPNTYWYMIKNPDFFGVFRQLIKGYR